TNHRRVRERAAQTAQTEGVQIESHALVAGWVRSAGRVTAVVVRPVEFRRQTEVAIRDLEEHRDPARGGSGLVHHVCADIVLFARGIEYHRTCVKGHPCRVARSGEAGRYEDLQLIRGREDLVPGHEPQSDVHI